MLHARSDYNHIQDPSGKIPEDEPVFLLRGQDALAPATLLDWCDKAKIFGVSPEMIKMVEHHAWKMQEWQNKGNRKIPDQPL